MTKKQSQCGLILEVCNGLVALQRRDGLRERPALAFPNCLGTWGGAIELGETPEQALRREIAEELPGYRLGELCYFGNFPYENYDQHIFRTIDTLLDPSSLVVAEGQGVVAVSLKDVEEGHYPFAFNCRDIVLAYYDLRSRGFRRD